MDGCESLLKRMDPASSNSDFIKQDHLGKSVLQPRLLPIVTVTKFLVTWEGYAFQDNKIM